MKNLDFGALEKPESGSNVPSSVTMLVSLFLILITFFVIINQNPSKQDIEKKQVALKSMQKKFGLPEDNEINFGGLMKPKTDDYALEMEQLFGKNARIEATVNGDEVAINASKNFFYFSDEVPFRPEKQEMLVKLQDILSRWDKSADLKITFVLGLKNYDLDKKRLEEFRRLMSRPGIDVGLDDGVRDKFSIIIKYE